MQADKACQLHAVLGKVNEHTVALISLENRNAGQGMIVRDI